MITYLCAKEPQAGTLSGSCVVCGVQTETGHELPFSDSFTGYSFLIHGNCTCSHCFAFFRDQSFIIGNTAALKAIRNAINTALSTPLGRSEFEAMVNDGEGYIVHVIQDDSDWFKGSWNKRAVPYFDEAASEKSEDAIHPYQDLK